MSMLAFMPWCRIHRVYEMDTIRILPIKPDARFEDIEDAERLRLNTILATYKTIEGNPVDRVAVVQHLGRSPVADLNEHERAVVRELVTLACFSGLAGRSTSILSVATAIPTASPFISRGLIKQCSLRSRLGGAMDSIECVAHRQDGHHYSGSLSRRSGGDPGRTPAKRSFESPFELRRG